MAPARKGPSYLPRAYGAQAAHARRRMTALLTAAGARPDEVQRLIAAIEAGAVERASDKMAMLAAAPAGSSDEFANGWNACVASARSSLALISDRTAQDACEATGMPPEIVPVVAGPREGFLPAMVDGAERARILEAAERIFVAMTGHTAFDRDLSHEILSVVVQCLSADEQHSYLDQLEAFAETNHERLATLYARYGPGGISEDESRCYLTH